jgi:hypothetical protein
MKLLTFEEKLARKKLADERARAKYLAKPRKLPTRRPLKRVKRPLRATKKVKIKKDTPAKLKKLLDAVFSKYIRAKYPKECYTCGRKDATLQCGHFVSRSYLNTRWNESNTRPQCVGCNLFGGGKPLDFEERLKRELGDEAVEALKKSRHTTLKVGRKYYEEQIALYQQALEKFTNPVLE